MRLIPDHLIQSESLGCSCVVVFFIKMGQSRALFVYFRPFLITISIIEIVKSVDGVLGIRAWGRRIVGADETMELWRPPLLVL